MSRRLTAALVAVACCLPLCGCGKSDSGNAPADKVLPGVDVDSVVREVNSFTDELEKTFESAQNPQAGVAEAQKLLDARRVSLAARIAAVKGGPQLQRDAAARRKWLEAEVDNTNRVHGLGSKLFDASVRDPELKARLDKLVGDYDAMFKDSAEH
jgi:hypothetical protein